MTRCPFCAHELSADAVHCTTCSARKSYDYRNSSTKRLALGAVGFVALAAVFLHIGYSSPDPNAFVGAKMWATWFGIAAAVNLFLLRRGRVWRRNSPTWPAEHQNS
jgi:hypothetical protein